MVSLSSWYKSDIFIGCVNMYNFKKSQHLNTFLFILMVILPNEYRLEVIV